MCYYWWVYEGRWRETVPETTGVVLVSVTCILPAFTLSLLLLCSIYRRAVAACGLDYRSDRLWGQYVDWEQGYGDQRKVIPIYDQLLATPTQNLASNFEKFLTFLESCDEPEAIVPEEELARLSGGKHPSISRPDEGDDASYGYYGDRSLKELIVEQRRELCSRTEVEVEKRKGYEEAIKRPYFHVKPLEKSQLKNWRDYLDYEMGQGDHRRIVVLFERCLISCAHYEDMWIKFADYCVRKEPSLARDVYSRACGVHLSKRPSIHLAWASFEERLGNQQGVGDVLMKAEEHLPGYVLLRIHRIVLATQQGDVQGVRQLYEDSIGSCRHWDREARCFWVCRYARFMSQIAADLPAARKILLDAIEHDKTSAQLYLQLLGLELWLSGGVVGDTMAIERVFQLVEESGMSEAAKQSFALRRLQLMEEYSPSLSKLLESYDRYDLLYKKSGGSKKRGALDGSNSEGGKKTKGNAVATETTNQWMAAAGNYGYTPSTTQWQSTPTTYQYSTTADHQPYGNTWTAYQQQYYGQ